MTEEEKKELKEQLFAFGSEYGANSKYYEDNMREIENWIESKKKQWELNAKIEALEDAKNKILHSMEGIYITKDNSKLVERAFFNETK